MDDPTVLGYWEDWQRVRESAALTGWTFADYVAARVLADAQVKITTTNGTNLLGGHGLVAARYRYGV